MSLGFRQPVKCEQPGCRITTSATFRANDRGGETLVGPPPGWREVVVKPSGRRVLLCPEHREAM